MTSPNIDSRVDSKTCTVGNPMPESTSTLCLSPSQGLRILPQDCCNHCNIGIGSQTLEPSGQISSTTPSQYVYFHLFPCILVGLYRSGSASPMSLVRSGRETFTEYKHCYTQGKSFSPYRIRLFTLSSICSECIFSGLFILLSLGLRLRQGCTLSLYRLSLSNK